MGFSSKRNQNGQAAVEMTFAFLIFFALFMAIVEFSHLLYAKVTLQHALRTAGRLHDYGENRHVRRQSYSAGSNDP